MGFHPAWFCPWRAKGGLQHDVVYLRDKIWWSPKEKIAQTLFGCYCTFVPPLRLRLGLRLALSRVSSWWVINSKRGEGVRKCNSAIIWNQKQISILKCYLVRLQAPWAVSFFIVCVFFPIQQWPCHNNIVTDGGLNLFDDCAAECVGRRVYLFFLGTQ